MAGGRPLTAMPPVAMAIVWMVATVMAYARRNSMLGKA